MKPWKTLDSAPGPDGQPLVLQQRDGEFVIRTGGHTLMSSASHGSEEAMADAGRPPPLERPPRVLVGGLGLGFTLRAVLNVLPPEARVVVVELSTAVIRWNQTVLSELAGRPLRDPRVELVEAEVLAFLERTKEKFDSVLLDVDNGPQALSRAGNERLYVRRGLAAVLSVLTPGGKLVVWSASPDAAFVTTLRERGFEAQQTQVPARPGARSKHILFVATKRG